MVNTSPQAMVVRHIAKRIETGFYSVAEPLPSERTISQELRVARGTARRALEYLTDQGLLVQNSNGKRVVAAKSQAGSAALMRSAVVLFMSYLDRVSGHRQPGWAEETGIGAMQAIHEAGRHAVAMRWEQLDDSLIAQLHQQQPMGVVIGQQSDLSRVSFLRQLHEQGVPVVAFGDDPDLMSFDRVVNDQAAGAEELVKFLASRGRRRILAIENQAAAHLAWAKARREGYERAMRQAGLEVLPSLTMPSFPLHNKYDASSFDVNRHFVAGYLVPHLTQPSLRVDAILCPSDGETFVVSAACRVFGITPGRDILVAGYDDYWQDSPERKHEPVPPVATVDKQNRETGGELVRMLQDRVEGKLPDGPQVRRVPPRLIVTE